MSKPNFIIAGERRGGTTALAKMLKLHPDIFIHPKGDSGWFVDDTVRSKTPDFSRKWEDEHQRQDYFDWFVQAGAQSQTAIGEKSADYLYWHPSHARIADFVPDTRLIITLRNPIARAWSHYWNEVAKGREVLGFEDAIAAEEERLKSSPYEKYCFSYLARGDYATSLAALFEHMPREQIMIVTLEELINNPKSVQKQICRFLQVDTDFEFPERHKKENSNWAVEPKPWAKSGIIAVIANAYSKLASAIVKLFVRDRTARRAALVKVKSPFFMPAAKLKMSASTKDRLNAHFREKTKDLEKLLGRKFDEWDFS